MTKKDPNLSGKERWLLWRVLIAELAVFDTGSYLAEAKQTLIPASLADETMFQRLLEREHRVLFKLPLEPRQNEWPTPIAMSFKLLLEENPELHFYQIHRLIDGFEVMVKYLAAINISDLLNRVNFSDEFKQLLAAHLRIPSLGHWIGFNNKAIEQLESQVNPPFIEEVISYYRNLDKKSLDQLLALRNHYAHGATKSNKYSWPDIEQNLPLYVKLMQHLSFLKNYPLYVSLNNDVQLFQGCEPELREIQDISFPFPAWTVALYNPNNNQWLKLSPLLSYRVTENQDSKPEISKNQLFFVYNDQKAKEKITYLSYEIGDHFRFKDAYPEFKERFPLQDWQQTTTEHFFQLIIDREISGFIGRQEVIARIHAWIATGDSGSMLILGKPGVGKTALMATLCKQEWPGIEIIPYFIKRGTISNKPEEFLTTTLQNLAIKFSLTNVYQNLSVNPLDLARTLRKQIEIIAKTLVQENKKLLLIVDGLDEAFEEDNKHWLLSYLDPTLPTRIFILMAGRSVYRNHALFNSIFEKWDNLTQIELEGLTELETRGLLYQGVNKYELQDWYVAEVTRLSQGNPLYVTLIMEELVEKHIILNNIKTLPQTMTEIYQKIIDRLAGENQHIIDLLITLAISQEHLTASQLACINCQTEQEVIAQLHHCSEVVTEELFASDIAKYRLFHDSFSEFLKNHKDYRAERTRKIKRNFLVYAAIPDRLPSLEPELQTIIDILMGGEALQPEYANLISTLVKRSARLLTPTRLILRCFLDRSLEETTATLLALARIPEPSTSHLVAQCLVAAADRSTLQVSEILENLTSEGFASQEKIGEVGIFQGICIALEVAVTLADTALAKDAVLKCILSACWHKNPNVRTLGIMAVFRTVRVNYAVGVEILRRLAAASLWHGILRPAKLESFAGSCLGLFFEDCNNRQLGADLHEMCSSLLSKTRGLYLGKWLLPRIATLFWQQVPEDVNPINLVEISAWKKRIGSQPELVNLLLKCIECIGPLVYQDDEVLQLIDELHPFLSKKENCLGVPLILDGVIISRILAGKEIFLEVAYDIWKKFKDSDTILNQNFMFQMRLIQRGLMQLGKPPLDEKWTNRTEEALRHFFYQRKTRFSATQEYICGSLLSGLPFLARQKGMVELPLLKEFVDSLFGPHKQSLELPGAPREKQMDAILLRAMEVHGIEFGTYDEYGCGLALYGLKCFFDYALEFDDFVWERVATILARLRTFFPDEISKFLLDLPRELNNQIQLRMSRIWPQENLSILVAMKTENLYATMFADTPGSNVGLRSHWQEALRVIVKNNSLTNMLGDIINLIIKIIR